AGPPAAALPETTAPMAAKPSAAPLNNPRATQMSASAVPSTLDSPAGAGGEKNGPPSASAAAAARASSSPSFATTVDEINGAAVIADGAQREEPRRASADVAGRRIGPPTLMSPAVVAPAPGESTPLAPENAVIDVGAPAHAFVPHGSGAPAGFGGLGAPSAMLNPGAGHGAGGAGQGRTSSTTFLLLVVGGIVAAVALLAVAVVLVIVVTRRRAADAADERAGRAPSGAVAPGAPGARGGAGAGGGSTARMGGKKARLAVTSAGALDPEAVRAATTSALPHIDACFAATELEAPNHESAAYDLDVAPSGEVKRAEPATPSGRSSKLDACVVELLRSIRLPKSAKASTVTLTFSAPIETP
ncbi:MAG: hypothetical protein JWP87_2782, partial [Labilithrix sp.]|nr:hypothetical protein [Labilithrix sp.]